MTNHDTTDDEDGTDTTTDIDIDLLDRLGYVAVPDVLRERDQWVCWRIEDRKKSDGTTEPTKVPLKPFESNHPYAKAADPKGDPSVTWGSFADAVAFHADPGTVNTDGIGFVFAPDDVVLGIDFDDVHDPDTETTEPLVTEWLDRLDTYTEYSPSGTGFHVLALGILPRGVGNRSGFEREDETLAEVFEDDPHVEVYDQKRFFTVTGDHVPGTPTTVEQRNDVIGELGEEVLADDDSASLSDFDGDSTPNVGVEVSLDDKQLVERAMQAGNGDKFRRLYRGDTAGYESHSEADMALCMMLAFWTQKDQQQMDSIFRSSGLMRPKWDEDRGTQTYGERTVATAVARQSDVYDPSRGNHSPDSDAPVVAPPADDSDDAGESDADGGDDTADDAEDGEERPAGEAAAVSDGGGGGGGDPDPPDDGDGDGGDDEDDEEEGSAVPKPGPGAVFTERGGCYGQWKENRSGEQYWDQWTNFEIEVNSFLMVGDRERKFDVTIHPANDHEPPFDVTIAPDDFEDVRQFGRNVACGFSTTFDGDRQALSRLKEFAAAQHAQHATGTHYMGRHDDEYVFPNGTLTVDGWTDEPEHVYVPRGSADTNNDSLGEMCTLSPDIGDDPDRKEAGRVAELLPKLHDPERFLPVLGWFYSVPFRQHVYEWTGQFNFLSITGETGSGKTRTTGLVNGAFGMDETPLSANDTTAYSVMMTFASSNAVPVWYDEFKPSDMNSQLVSDFSSSLRAATTSNSPQRGQQSGGVSSATLKAPVAIGGEEQIQGSAEERRGIFTTYPKGVTDPSSPSREVYEELNGTVTTEGRDLSHHALAYYQFALSLDAGVVRDLWTRAGKYVDAFCDERGIEGLEDLVVQGLVTIRFGLLLHNQFCQWLGTATNPVTAEEIDGALEYVVTDSTGGLNRQTHVDEYLSLIARAAMADRLVRDEHYTFVHAGRDDRPTELRFHPSSTYDIVKRYANDHDATEDLLNSKDDYRERFRDQLNGGGDTYVSVVSQNTAPLYKRCDGVRLRDAEAAVDGFERSMFDAPELKASEDARGASDPDTVTPLGSVTASQSYVDVEVTAAAVRHPDSDAIALAATVTDDTGAVDVVQWDGDPVGIVEGERYRFRDVNVSSNEDGQLRLTVAPGVTSVEQLAATDPATDPDTDTDPDANDDGGDGGGGGSEFIDAVDDLDAATEAGDEQESDDDGDGADGGDVVGDGGTAAEVYEDDRGTVLQTVRDHEPVSEGVLLGATGLAPADAADALEKLVEAGRVLERVDDGKYELP